MPGLKITPTRVACAAAARTGVQSLAIANNAFCVAGRPVGWKLVETGLKRGMDSLENHKRVLRPSVALDANREAVRALIARYPVRNPHVFGSVAQGTDRVGSDLDILVDATPETDLFNLGRLFGELEDLLGVAVDLLTPGDLPGKIRARVLEQASPI